MPDVDPSPSDSYKRRAQELRALATNARDLATGEGYLWLASHYESLARAVERMKGAHVPIA